MELPAAGERPVPVPGPERDVARLLDLAEEEPWPQAVESAGRDQERRTRVYRQLGGDIQHLPTADRPSERVCIDPGLDPGEYPRPGRGLDEVPRLRLAPFRRPHQRAGLLIVRVNLDRQPVGGVDHFDDDRKPRPEPSDDVRAEQLRPVGGGQLIERNPRNRPGGDPALAERHPRFADGRFRAAEANTAPDSLAILGLQAEKRRHLSAGGFLWRHPQRLHGDCVGGSASAPRAHQYWE